MEPLVPVTVMVEVGGWLMVERPKPPPHPLSVASTMPKSTRHSRPLHLRIRLTGIKKKTAASTGAATGQRGMLVVFSSAVCMLVCTVMVLVAPALPGVTLTGVKETVAPVGIPLAVKVTGWVKLPSTDATDTVYCAAEPADTACVAGVAVTAKSAAATTGAVPVPVSDEVCGEPAALSATVSDAVTDPVNVGAKITEIVHFPPAASEVPHVFVLLNTLVFVPVSEMPVMLSAAFPVLLRVAVCAVLLLPVVTEPKARIDGVRVAAGDVATAVPIPLRLDACVPRLSNTLSEAEALPAAIGLKVMPMVQEELAASEEPQLFVPMLNTDAFVPVRVTDVMGSDAVPALVRVKSCDVLALPTFTLPKFAVAGVSAACGTWDEDVPLQVKAIDCGGKAGGFPKLALRLAVRVSTITGSQLS